MPAGSKSWPTGASSRLACSTNRPRSCWAAGCPRRWFPGETGLGACWPKRRGRQERACLGGRQRLDPGCQRIRHGVGFIVQRRTWSARKTASTAQIAQASAAVMSSVSDDGDTRSELHCKRSIIVRFAFLNLGGISMRRTPSFLLFLTIASVLAPAVALAQINPTPEPTSRATVTGARSGSGRGFGLGAVAFYQPETGTVSNTVPNLLLTWGNAGGQFHLEGFSACITRMALTSTWRREAGTTCMRLLRPTSRWGRAGVHKEGETTPL